MGEHYLCPVCCQDNQVVKVSSLTDRVTILQIPQEMQAPEPFVLEAMPKKAYTGLIWLGCIILFAAILMAVYAKFAVVLFPTVLKAWQWAAVISSFMNLCVGTWFAFCGVAEYREYKRKLALANSINEYGLIRYERRKFLWDNLYYCIRDRCVFLPLFAFAKAENAQEFLELAAINEFYKYQ